MKKNASLYFHFPCFDGIISGVLAAGFLKTKGWLFKGFFPVDYSIRATWLSNRLKEHSAVVDFLYHPDATFWADHHLTSFLSEELRRGFEKQRDPWKLYDSEAPSCASLLWQHVSDSLPSDRYREMVKWANIIDAARYQSVEEAILGDAPALRIRSSLMSKADSAYGVFLIRQLRTKSLAEVASLPKVTVRYGRVRSLIKTGLRRFKGSAHLTDGDIVTFHTELAEDCIYSRYAPFYFFPSARYSIGLTQSLDEVKITAMRNPWREFPSVPLGSIFARYGGGGHERVGAVVLSRGTSVQANEIIRTVVNELQIPPPGIEMPRAIHAPA